MNHIFDDLYLGHISCVYAYRRPDMNYHGVVIASLNSLSDKREVLERKRYLRTMSQYRNVFLKPSKSHPEQVMDANFSFLLNELTNGDAYFISDNGRIRQKTRKVQYIGHSVPYCNGNTYYPSSESHGGARPNYTHYYDNYRNPAFDYGNS